MLACPGELSEFHGSFERLLPRVRRIVALRMVCRESELWDREDLVQETLIDAFRNLEGFEDRHDGALCHWLATLVENNLRGHKRWRKALDSSGSSVPLVSISEGKRENGRRSSIPR